MVYISSTSRLAERCELLKKYDLDYHREKRGFICGTCAHFIVMAGVQSHLRGHKLYMQDGEELELQRVYNPLQGDERAAISGSGVRGGGDRSHSCLALGDIGGGRPKDSRGLMVVPRVQVHE